MGAWAGQMRGARAESPVAPSYFQSRIAPKATQAIHAVPARTGITRRSMYFMIASCGVAGFGAQSVPTALGLLFSISTTREGNLIARYRSFPSCRSRREGNRLQLGRLNLSWGRAGAQSAARTRWRWSWERWRERTGSVGLEGAWRPSKAFWSVLD